MNFFINAANNYDNDGFEAAGATLTFNPLLNNLSCEYYKDQENYFTLRVNHRNGYVATDGEKVFVYIINAYSFSGVMVSTFACALPRYTLDDIDIHPFLNKDQFISQATKLFGKIVFLN